MIEINKHPRPQELIQFGIIWLPLLLVILIWLLTSRFSSPWPTILLAIIAGLSLVTGWLQPRLLQPLFVGLQYITFPIGFVLSYVLLAIVFFGLITPVGWLLRLFGYDPLQIRQPKDTHSMWHQRDPNMEPSSYFRQF